MGRALAITTKWLCVLSPLLAWMPEPAAAQGCEWARGFQSPGASDPLRALTVFDDGTGPALYAGGEFTTAGDVAANRIAKWDGTQWSALRSGMNGSVLGLAVFDDGTGPALYAGGEFTTAGDVAANRIAKWDGRQWSALGGGMNASVLGLAVFDDGTGPALYAGGEFTTAGGVVVNNIAKWEGRQWSALGGGTNMPVYALTVFDDGAGPALYAGGIFSGAGDVAATKIAKWNGTQWSALGTGIHGPYVNALAVFDDGTGPALYAGGEFIIAGDIAANRIAKWDGTRWSVLGSGVNSSIRALMVFGDGSGPALYAGGDFTAAGGVAAHHLAKWDGTQWSAIGSGMNFAVSVLRVFDNGTGPALYAGGEFTTADAIAANYIAKWDGMQWSAIGSGSGMSQLLSALTVFDNGTGPALYAGGNFSAAGSAAANYVARWDGIQWSALGSGVIGQFPYVSALTIFDDGSGSALYAGGQFTTAGGVVVNNIAKWDGTQWSALGSGLGVEGCDSCGHVLALTVFDDGSGPALYAGGGFTRAGGVVVNSIAKWNGTQWSALGSGVNGEFASVLALTVFDDGSGPALYAGGGFTTAGGVAANYIANWNGAQWSTLGSGMNRPVYALTVFNDGSSPALYAGGQFTTAGGTTSSRIAAWRCATP